MSDRPPLLEEWSLTSPLAKASTETRFIQHLAKGTTLPAANFNSWLYNDFVYVRSHIHFVARLIQVLPTEAPDIAEYDANAFLKELDHTLRDGYTVLGAELDEFRKRVGERGLKLPALPPVPASPEEEVQKPLQTLYDELAGIEGVKDGCKEHMKFMLLTLAGGDNHWTTLFCVLWLSEKVYCDAMWYIKDSEGFGKLDATTAGFIEWWANDMFKEYVDLLGEGVEKARMKGITWKARKEEAKIAVAGLLKGEQAFWEMSEEGLE